MKTIICSSSTAVKTVFGSLARPAGIPCPCQPQAAQATDGGATIYNTVKVTYQSGTTTLFATANVSVTAATPCGTADGDQPGQPDRRRRRPRHLQLYRPSPEEMGLDTYTTSVLANAATEARPPPRPADAFSLGGIALGSGAGNITVPFGSTTGLTAGTSTVQIGANQYTNGLAAGMRHWTMVRATGGRGPLATLTLH